MEITYYLIFLFTILIFSSQVFSIDLSWTVTFGKTIKDSSCTGSYALIEDSHRWYDLTLTTKDKELPITPYIVLPNQVFTLLSYSHEIEFTSSKFKSNSKNLTQVWISFSIEETNNDKFSKFNKLDGQGVSTSEIILFAIKYVILGKIFNSENDDKIITAQLGEIYDSLNPTKIINKNNKIKTLVKKKSNLKKFFKKF